MCDLNDNINMHLKRVSMKVVHWVYLEQQTSGRF
jgi:hypothetical protein